MINFMFRRLSDRNCHLSLSFGINVPLLQNFTLFFRAHLKQDEQRWNDTTAFNINTINKRVTVTVLWC